MFGPSPRACSWRSDWRTRSIPTRKLVSRKDSGRHVPRRLPVSRSTAWLVRIWNTSPGGKNPHPSLIVESPRSEEHTSELQSQSNLVCRLLLEKKKNYVTISIHPGIKLSDA